MPGAAAPLARQAHPHLAEGVSGMTGLVVAGQVFRLPPGARAVPAPATLRPLPGAPPGLRGVTVLEGRLLPAWVPDLTLDPALARWVLLDGGLIGGNDACDAVADAPPLRLPVVPAAPPPPPPAAMPAVPPPPALSASSAGMVVLRLGDGALSLPLAALVAIRPYPKLATPVPGLPAGAHRYASTADGPVLLLDAAWCFGNAAAAEAPEHLAVLRHDGRQLGLPCARIAPGAGAAPLLPRLGGAEGARLLALAPCPIETPQAAPPLSQDLLLCLAGRQRFFLPAAAVQAVIPPQSPQPLPGHNPGGGMMGLCAHRGDILPVRDAALALGSGTLPLAPPLLRLAGPSPCALAVSAVFGLKAMPEAAVTPVAGDRMVQALVQVEGEALPLCRAAAFAEPA